MTTDQKDLLKQLVEAPYGEAEHILKKNGHWDERRGMDPNEKRTWKVKLRGERIVEATVSVEATSEEEACDIAEEMSGDRLFRWEETTDVGFVDAEAVECRK